MGIAPDLGSLSMVNSSSHSNNQEAFRAEWLLNPLGWGEAQCNHSLLAFRASRRAMASSNYSNRSILVILDSKDNNFSNSKLRHSSPFRQARPSNSSSLPLNRNDRSQQE